ncbi:MAG TPA: threonine synthase [Trueperaceae bacterium]|nr:threonine synthase [Trueperaceae bacterium]
MSATGVASGVGFRSTRGLAPEVSFEEALLAGLAPDGGLYLPTELPASDGTWREATHPAEVAAAVLPPLLGLEAGEVEAVFREALDFPLPVVSLAPGLHVLELFHGPTAAFKDVGARAMARLMDRALARRGESATVLVATSGDTGGAVADAFAGLGAVRVAVLFPRGQVSDVQEAQLTAVRPGVTAYAVEGTFDDCQRLVKGALVDERLADLRLSTANSINVGRLLPQVVYYLWAAVALRRAGVERDPWFVVPSGNLGNLTAGLLAAQLGPLTARFVAAHNANDYFVRFLAGAAEPHAFAGSVRTLSNAMDVGGPSNFERLYAARGYGLRDLVTGQAVSDAATLERMRETHADLGYLACPHTAVGLEAAHRERLGGRGGPAVVLATAHPAKFPDTVARATGVVPPPHPGLARFERAEKRAVPLPADPSALRSELLASA